MQNERDWTESPAIAYRLEQGAELETVIPRDGTSDAGLVVMRVEGRRRMFRVRNAFGSYPQVREALPEEARYHVREYAPVQMPEFFPDEDRSDGPSDRLSDDKEPRNSPIQDSNDIEPSELAEPFDQAEDETGDPAKESLSASYKNARNSGKENSPSRSITADTISTEKISLEEDASSEATGDGNKPEDEVERFRTSEAAESLSEETGVERECTEPSDAIDVPTTQEDAAERIECERDGSDDQGCTVDKTECGRGEEENHVNGDEDNGEARSQNDCAQMGGIVASLMA